MYVAAYSNGDRRLITAVFRTSISRGAAGVEVVVGHC